MNICQVMLCIIICDMDKRLHFKLCVVAHHTQKAFDTNTHLEGLQLPAMSVKYTMMRAMK